VCPFAQRRAGQLDAVVPVNYLLPVQWQMIDRYSPERWQAILRWRCSLAAAKVARLLLRSICIGIVAIDANLKAPVMTTGPVVSQMQKSLAFSGTVTVPLGGPIARNFRCAARLAELIAVING
jgi:hypothetical protein